MIDRADLRCDVHTHTLFSRHAYSTIEENVRAAARAGLELIGSTDHFSDMLFVDQGLRNFQFFINQRVWPRTWHGVTLLRGAEADIVDLDGHLFGHGMPQPTKITGERYGKALDLDERIFDELDYAIASVHGKRFAEGATPAQVTSMYVRALENPKVMILGHIGRSGLEFELDPVLEAARDMHKLIEINAHSFGRKPATEQACRDIARRCAELGTGICVSSDAHVSPAIGALDSACAVLSDLDFPLELVASRDRASFVSALKAAGVCDLTDLLVADSERTDGL